MSRLSAKQWLLRASLPLMAALLWAVPVSVRASILLPDQSPLGRERILAEADDVGPGASSMSCALPDRPAADKPLYELFPDREEPSEDVLSQSYLLPWTPVSGASTSTCTGGVSAPPIAVFAAISASGPALVTWGVCQRRVMLPIPPTNELVRPPQQVCYSDLLE